ncbi:MAG TPA: prenyltransferase/squalene oxidase repeat-containing protein, partial [Bryobacteraceae bacterium]|nr:prenyltransferase/squalene oxidase repeat-containing protein [Bryobacteraceae bacterium]
NGNPVLQHQAMAVLVRHLVGIAPSPADQVWRDYFHQRRRANGSFHHTVAADGSGGHVTNTLWAVLALEALGEKPEIGDPLVSWIESCQLASGGFTYAPDAQIGGVDDVFYTWAALRLLDRAGRTPRRADACLTWLSSLAGNDGGYQDRPGGVPNPVATYYALDCFRLLKQEPRAASRRAAGPVHHPIPDGSRIFTMQVEAPGAGSPTEAVLMAEKLGIHIWAAKNAAPGWVAEAQRIAGVRKVPVLFAVGNEEYGTYVSVPGLGTYSHLSDLVAPASRDFGAQLPKKNFAYPWPEFRDTRIRALQNGLGRMVWQFNENEEFTRALLDEADEKRTYAAISTFHFGNENFLESQPFLMRWYGRLPMVALQDAHGGESWWWGDFLSGFRTLFIAREPTWEAWLEALDRDHVVSVRHDAITNWSTHIAGGPPHVREFIRKNSGQWVWWGDEGAPRQRPPAALTVLKPEMPFETAVPAAGTNIRLRLWADHTGQAVPKEPRAELVSLRVDDRVVKPAPVSTAHDRYWLYELQDSNARRVTAVVRVLATGKEVTISTELS